MKGFRGLSHEHHIVVVILHYNYYYLFSIILFSSSITVTIMSYYVDQRIRVSVFNATVFIYILLLTCKFILSSNAVSLVCLSRCVLLICSF